MIALRYAAVGGDVATASTSYAVDLASGVALIEASWNLALALALRGSLTTY
jgi:hypothetical protein